MGPPWWDPVPCERRCRVRAICKPGREPSWGPERASISVLNFQPGLWEMNICCFSLFPLPPPTVVQDTITSAPWTNTSCPNLSSLPCLLSAPNWTLSSLRTWLVDHLNWLLPPTPRIVWKPLPARCLSYHHTIPLLVPAPGKPNHSIPSTRLSKCLEKNTQLCRFLYFSPEDSLSCPQGCCISPRHPHISSSPWHTAWPLHSWEAPFLFLSDISLNFNLLSVLSLVAASSAHGVGGSPCPSSSHRPWRCSGCHPAWNHSNTTSHKPGTLVTHSSFPFFTTKAGTSYGVLHSDLALVTTLWHQSPSTALRLLWEIHAKLPWAVQCHELCLHLLHLGSISSY